MNGNESVKSDRVRSGRAAYSPDRKTVGGSGETSIGVGKKVGIYGVGLLLLGLMVVIATALLVMHYAPFASMEGVGP
jgi:hypothetical protein